MAGSISRQELQKQSQNRNGSFITLNRTQLFNKVSDSNRKYNANYTINNIPKAHIALK